MPSRRQALLDLSKPMGLSVSGPTTGIAPTFLVRARGLHELCEHEYRLAPLDAVVLTRSGIHSITRFNDLRYVGAGTDVYRNGVSIFTNATSDVLTFQRIPPGNTQPDQLFWSGGGRTRKSTSAGVVTNWGIDAPPNGFTGALVAQLTKTVELFENSADWAVVGVGVTVANSATIKQEGVNALRVNVPVDTIAMLTKASTLNLAQFTVAGDTSNEDIIELWVRVDGDSAGIDYITLRFDVDAANFATNYYEFTFPPRAITVNNMVQTGIGANSGVNADEAGFLANVGGSEDSGGTESSPSAADSDPGQGTDAFVASSTTWTRLRIGKSRFLRSGNSATTWADVTAVQLLIKTNALSSVTCYFDYARMRGGAGLRGDYQSLVTFDNTITGARSNSNPTPAVVRQNDRQKLSYASLPLSTDPQVNARTLWRTFGNGTRFFREHVIADNTTTAYVSAVADFIGLWTNENSQILYLPELPTDNARPEDTHTDFLYDQATVFWLSSAANQQGRLYYSPAGRPEAQRGFIQLCNDDTPLYRIILWQRARYVIGEGGWYRIDGTEPYTAFKFQGVAGVLEGQARTIVPTPYGIVWNAKDGLRIFNGSTSQLIYPERLVNLFRGESPENLTSFMGTCAAFARDQYFISDGTQTLAINLATGLIRDLGKGYQAFYYEEDTRALLAATSTQLIIVEDGVVGTGTRSYALRTPSYLFPEDTVGYVDQVFIDGNLKGTPSLILDTTTVPLAALAPVGRQLLERQVGYPCRAVSLDLAGTDTTGHALYGAECAVRDLTLELLIPTRNTVDRQGVLAIKARSSDLTQSILFQVLEEQRQHEPFDNYLLAYYLTLDLDTNGASIIPTLLFEEGSLILPGIVTNSRALVQLPFARLGHFLSLTLSGNFMTPVTIYRAELEMRPVVLSVLVNGERLPTQARMRTTGQGLTFEIPDHTWMGMTPAQAVILKRLVLDADTGGTLLHPSVLTDSGLSALPAMSTNAREHREYPLGLLGRPRQILLDCDVPKINALYDAELHCYVATKRG